MEAAVLLKGVRGIWVGVPLATFEEWYWEIADYEFLADWTEIDAKIAAMPLFHRLRNLSKGIRTMSIRGVTDEPAVYRVPPVLMEVNENCHPIIYGRILKLNPFSECDQDLNKIIRMQKMGRARKDGIKVFGDGDVRAISIGVQVGSYDPETGRRAISPDFCAARGEMLRPIGKYESERLIQHHPDLSDLGYWHMKPDGSVSEVTPANMMRDTS